MKNVKNAHLLEFFLSIAVETQLTFAKKKKKLIIYLVSFSIFGFCFPMKDWLFKQDLSTYPQEVHGQLLMGLEQRHGGKDDVHIEETLGTAL